VIVSVRKDGYARVKCVAHEEFGTRWVLRSHFVWWRWRRQRVKRGWCLHHKDEDRLHDVISNLQLMTRAAHSKLHKEGKVLGPLTTAHKKLISSALKGKPKSALHKTHLRKPKGTEGKLNIAASNKARVFTPDMLRRMSRQGSKHSDKTKLRMSKASKGKPKSLLHRLHMKQAWVRRKAAKNG
jgi:hypothetical protein